MSKIKHTNKAIEEICPKCGSTYPQIAYGDCVIGEGYMHYECTCENCNLEFHEVYGLVFDSHYIPSEQISIKSERE